MIITKYILSIIIGEFGYYTVLSGNKPIEYSRIIDKKYGYFYLDNLLTLHNRIDPDRTAVFLETQYPHTGNSEKCNFNLGYAFGLFRGTLYNNFNNFYCIDPRYWKKQLTKANLTKEEKELFKDKKYEELSKLCTKDFREYFLAIIKKVKADIINSGRISSYYLFNKLGLYKFIDKNFWHLDCLITSVMMGYWASNFSQQLTDLKELHEKYKINNKKQHYGKLKHAVNKVVLNKVDENGKILT